MSALVCGAGYSAARVLHAVVLGRTPRSGSNCRSRLSNLCETETTSRSELRACGVASCSQGGWPGVMVGMESRSTRADANWAATVGSQVDCANRAKSEPTCRSELRACGVASGSLAGCCGESDGKWCSKRACAVNLASTLGSHGKLR